MKTKFTLIALISAMAGVAQAPSGYYSTATGTGYTLKTQLYNIIKGHTTKGITVCTQLIKLQTLIIFTRKMEASWICIPRIQME